VKPLSRMQLEGVMTDPREVLERMVEAGRKYIGASDPADEYFLGAALRELVEIHSGDRPASAPTLEHTILAITELEL